MTRAQARKVVVDNAKRKWMDDRWNVAMAGKYGDMLRFETWREEYVKTGACKLQGEPVWVFARKDLEAKGLL